MYIWIHIIKGCVTFSAVSNESKRCINKTAVGNTATAKAGQPGCHLMRYTRPFC